MNDKLDRLAGELHLHPGTDAAIRGGRPDAARLAIDRPADELPALLGALFTLCSHAHRMTARHALAAARGEAAAPTQAECQALRLATARDQLLRIAHDWPRQLDPLARGHDAGMDLPSCPLWHADAPDAARMALLPTWLADHWLGMAPEAWLSRFQDDPARWAAQWAQRAPGPLAALLRGVLPLAEATPAAGPAWRPLADPLPAMTTLAHALAVRTSPWPAGVVPDTGPWSRQDDSRHASAQNAWMRLASRLVDLLHLATPGGESWLAQGALALPGRQGIAWCEMARGLLVHWVALDERAERIADLRVLAPTDLNFHPQGVLAQALSALPPQGAADRARVLAVAFDPCVAFDVVTERETARA